MENKWIYHKLLAIMNYNYLIMLTQQDRKYKNYCIEISGTFQFIINIIKETKRKNIGKLLSF